MESWDNSWTTAKRLWTVAVCSSALWVGTHTSVLSSPKASLQPWNKQAWTHGPRLRGPTAPVGWAQNAISTPDVFVRFGSATTSKSDLIVFDWYDYSVLPSFSLFLGGKDIIIQPHLFNCSNWSHSNWAWPFICNGNDYEIVLVQSDLVWWAKVCMIWLLQLRLVYFLNILF